MPNAPEAAERKVARANRSMLWIVGAAAVVVIVIVGAVLGGLYLYVSAGRATSCQTNEIVRQLDADVNALIRAAHAHEHTRYIVPGPIIAPPQCR